MLSPATSQKQVDLLRSRYLWPVKRPAYNPAEWALDGGGRELVTKRINKDEIFLIVEVGVFLGSSVKQWLAVSPKVHVIAIDPWEGDWWATYAKEKGREELVAQFKEKDGPYGTFLSSLWEYRDRLFPVKGTSPDKLYELHEMGIQPQLVYFDSNKTGDDIEVAHTLFPHAILTGDDWWWGTGEGYPIRKAVRRFAKRNGYYVRSQRSTWVLDRNKYMLVDYLNNLIQFARGIYFWLKRG